MDQSLQQLFKSSEFKEGEFSILIQGDETKNSYELNSNNSRIPASLSKLVVAGMAYHYLEPNFVWTTKLLSLSEPKNDIFLVIAISELPMSVKEFLKFTFEVIEEDKPHKTAAAFTFGRENLIPMMFNSIIEKIQKRV